MVIEATLHPDLISTNKLFVGFVRLRDIGAQFVWYAITRFVAFHSVCRQRDIASVSKDVHSITLPIIDLSWRAWLSVL